MIVFQAPYELLQTTVSIRSPSLGNSKAKLDKVVARNSMNGTLYSYVKRPGLIELSYDFILDEAKAFELEAFIAAYSVDWWRHIDFDGHVYKVKLKTMPVEFNTVSRGEQTTVQFNLQGFQLI